MSTAPGARRPFIAAANWKMNLVSRDVEGYMRELHAGLAASPTRAALILFPSFPLLPAVARELSGQIALGAQDLHPEDAGAHTGDVSGAQLAGAGCTWVLCGHSERRRDHGESDELVGRKVAAASRHRLTPMICAGETRQERAAGRTLEVLERQLRAANPAHPANAANAGAYAIAYEPVWAIGTGEHATPDTVQEAHGFLRRVLAELGDAEAALRPILYGGSVTPDNAAELAAAPDVDGFLVGGASLVAARFLAIARARG